MFSRVNVYGNSRFCKCSIKKNLIFSLTLVVISRLVSPRKTKPQLHGISYAPSVKRGILSIDYFVKLLTFLCGLCRSGTAVSAITLRMPHHSVGETS